MINFRVGIIGAGNIAGTIADTLNKLDAFEPYAIASRDINKANEFGDKYNVEKRYGSYEELANDPDVELIYICTPHSNHAEVAKMCLNAGKPVLVEKAFSYDSISTEEVLNLSKEKNIFCGEAMWSRFLPMYKQLMTYIKSGIIGKVYSMHCSIGYKLFDKERITNPALAGGALLDLGVYPINIIAMIFGTEPATVLSSCARFSSGADAQDMIHFSMKEGRSATVFITTMYTTDNSIKIYGDKGYIIVENILNPTAIKLYKADGELIGTTEPLDTQITGYEYEFIAARDAIILGRTECEEMPHSETLRLMRFMDSVRKTWRYRFPMEPNEAPATNPTARV